MRTYVPIRIEFSMVDATTRYNEKKTTALIGRNIIIYIYLIILPILTPQFFQDNIIL